MTTVIHPPAQELLRSWRHDFHRHPETAFEEKRTNARLLEILNELPNLAVHSGWGHGTGIVAVLKGTGGPGPSIGLRAYIDALDVDELTDLPYQSTIEGKMHACGHDGHMTMLLGAVHSLARQPDFAGTVHFIFQPAEENEGGARVMVEEGLFERFPMDAVFARSEERRVGKEWKAWRGSARRERKQRDQRTRGVHDGRRESSRAT